MRIVAFLLSQLNKKNNMETKITLTDFLQEQEQPSYLCIIKVDTDEPNKLKLIRWMERRGSCDLSQHVDVNIDLIDFIKPTHLFHFIDDKKYTVVAVTFKENATVPVGDLVSAAWRKRVFADVRRRHDGLDWI